MSIKLEALLNSSLINEFRWLTGSFKLYEHKTRTTPEQLPLLMNLGGLQEVSNCINTEVNTSQFHNQPTYIGAYMELAPPAYLL